jgi:hypothetical protein
MKIDQYLCSVRFQTDKWYVELLVLAREGPKFSPYVEIGPRPECGILTWQNQVDILRQLYT